MFVRASNSIHKKIMEKYKHLDPVIVYSMWKGYMQQDEVKEFLEGYRRIDMHTSGHGDSSAIKAVIDAVDPDMVIPMHTEVPEAFLDIAGKDRVVLPEDKTVIELQEAL